MKKTVKTLLRLFAAFMLAGGVYLYGCGYSCYREAVKTAPIQDVVDHYTSMSGYLYFEMIDEDFVNAVTAVEDQRYFHRRGVDYLALARAIRNNFLYGFGVEGGSTITQQIAKNLYFQNRGRGLEAKMAEIIFMYELENMYSKEELFALYTNMNYYGDGWWGLRRASWGYYQVGPDDLSAAKAAMLAGIINAPGAYQLSTGYDLALQRQRKVLSRMYEEGYLTYEQYLTALEEPV